ncbi:O-antigen ligase family protein [Falsiroseomonas oryziterrae]|uniref:O-antigen ligase family protein n=1 Tax=Falsiroseomonas oryziterrae TaxID=2911368 RepID=UPI001F1AF338|nr:O-antigen ligase family protein [Roseomonas sp. NPKOSM-4]
MMRPWPGAGIAVAGAPPHPHDTASATQAWVEPGRGLLWDLVPAFGLIALVMLGTAVGLGGLMRLVFPMLALAVGVALLGTRRTGAYVCFCIWLFVLTPWLRRWMDLDLGWLRVNPVMLAPWAASAPSLVLLLRMVAGPAFPLAGPMLVAIVAAGYGLVLGVAQGSLTGAVFDWLRYAVPPCFAALVIVALPESPSLPRRVVRTLALGAALAGVYGVVQFTILPAWDAEWVRDVIEFARMTSIGYPFPYEVRVFSLLNSPHSLAAFLGAAMPFLIVIPGPLQLVALACAAAGLLLTMARTYWLAVAAAVLYLLVRGRPGLKVQAAIVVGGLLVLLPAAAVFVPEAMTSVTERLATLGADRLDADISANSREGDYRALVDLLEIQPLGVGLGNGLTFDGQVIESYYALGLVAGSVYLAAVAWCFAVSLVGVRRGAPPVALAGSAVALQVLLAAPLSSAFVGELGMFGWLAMAFCHLRPAHGGPEPLRA